MPLFILSTPKELFFSYFSDSWRSAAGLPADGDGVAFAMRDGCRTDDEQSPFATNPGGVNVANVAKRAWRFDIFLTG